MSILIPVSESGLLLSGQGKLKGVVVNSHTSGTLKIYDGLEAGAVAVGTITQSVGAATPAFHATNTITSIGASAAATHATGTLTSGGTNFLDATKASAVLTSDQTQPTAGKVVILGGTTYTFVALGASATRTATAVNVPLGNNCLETINNLFNAMERQATTDLVSVVRTSAYVITVTALTAGIAGNSIAATEDDLHLDWDGSNTTLTGGTAAETVTIGSVVYTFKNVLDTVSTATAVQVKIGATTTASLLNLKYAINATAAYIGKSCGFGTTAHTSVVAYSSDATTVVIYANVVGASLNALATTETCADATWGGTTLVDGVATTSSTVTIGANVYTQVDVLSETLGAPAVANQFLRGASEATMLDALKAAINGTSVGTLCSTGTVAHPYIVATTNADDSQIVRARFVGNAAYTAIINALDTTETMANTAWTAVTMGAGTGASDPSIATTAATITINGRVYTAVLELDETLTGVALADQILWVTDEATFLDNLKMAINASGTAGTQYSTGTTTNKDVIATTNGAATQVIQSRLNGVAGNAITTTATLTNYAWGATTLASGTGLTSKVMFNTITLGTLTAEFGRFMDLGDTDFTRGVFVIVGGAADVSFVVNLS